MVSQQLDTIHKSIEKDPALRQRLDKVTDKQAYVDLLVEIGGKNGMQVSAADIDTVLSEAKGNRTVGAMSDQQLESVAGGGFFESWYYERFTSGFVKCS